MSVGAIVLMVFSLVFVISGLIFFIIMDFKNHKKQKNETTSDDDKV